MAYITIGNGPGLVVICVLSLFLTSAFSSVRIYVRWFRLRIWKLEDWFFVASQATFTLLTVCALLAAIHGNGQYLSILSTTDIPVVLKYWYIGELFYSSTTILIRLSIGFFLLRVCVFNPHNIIIRICMVLMTTIGFAYLVFNIFQCQPVSYFWLQFSGEKGQCLRAQDVLNVTIGYSVIAAIVDMIFGIIPLFVIWNLRMNPKAKAIVGFILALGIFAGITVIVRIWYVTRVDLTAEFLHATSAVSIWSTIEPAIGICCMAASTYRPLFTSLRETTTTSSSRSNKPSYVNTNYTNNSITLDTSHFRTSKSPKGMCGYLKSRDDGRDKGRNSFDEVIVLENIKSEIQGPGRGPLGKPKWQRREEWEEDDYIPPEGIFRTNVEICRSPGLRI